MPEAHENLEHAEHAEHAAHSNKKIALLISVLALFLRSPRRWARARRPRRSAPMSRPPKPGPFFQAKTIRQTMVRTAAEADESHCRAASDRQPRRRWRSRSRPGRNRGALRFRAGDNEGRKELSERAKEAEESRDIGWRSTTLRDRFGGVSDRHRAGLGRGHHRHRCARLARRGAWRRRACGSGARPIRARTSRTTFCRRRNGCANAARPSGTRHAAPRLSAALRENLKRRKAQVLDAVLRPAWLTCTAPPKPAAEPHQQLPTFAAIGVASSRRLIKLRGWGGKG